MCAGAACDAEQGGAAGDERRSVDRAVFEGHRSAGGGESTPWLHHFGPVTEHISNICTELINSHMCVCV